MKLKIYQQHKYTFQKATFLILAAILVILLVTMGINASNEENSVVENGEYTMSGQPAPYASFYIGGEWEFYPNVMLYADNDSIINDSETIISSENAEHISSSSDNEIADIDEKWIDVGVDDEVLQPVMVTVPDKWIGTNLSHVPETGSGSYRIMLHNSAPYLGNGNFLLLLQGFLQEYRVYINGELSTGRLPSPYGYQMYPINDSGDVEIVIELINSTTGLTTIPELFYIGSHMSNIDTTRNMLFIILTLCIILFVMFFMFSFSSGAGRLRPVVLQGLVLTFLLLFDTLWGTGYLDSINKIISNNVLSMIVLLMQLAVLGFGIGIFQKCYSQAMKKSIMIVCEVMIAASLLLYGTGIQLLHWQNVWFAVYALMLYSLILWVLCALRGIELGLDDCVQHSMLFMLTYFASVCSCLFTWYPKHYSILYSTPVVLVLIIVNCFVIYYQCHKRELQRMQELLELEQYAYKTQTALLSSQIQPHFLYNTLLTIQELCRFDPAEASRVIVRFSEYLRHNIDFMNYDELLPFESEERHIDNFIYIQEVRFQDKLQYSSDIEVRDFMIPPLTVQPIVENAVKYGVRGKISGGTVNLHVYKDDLGIHIVVRNSGPGFDTSNVRQDHSLGNIQKRLKTLLNASLSIKSSEGVEGTVVEIFIPENEIRHQKGSTQ